MIEKFREAVERPKTLVEVCVLQIAMALLQGALIGMLLPVFRALLRTAPDFAAAAPWLVAGGAGLLLYIACVLIVNPLVFAASMELTAQIRRKLVEHTAKLSPGWFSAENKARLSRAVTGYSSAIGALSVTYGAQILLNTVAPSALCLLVLIIDRRIALPLIAGIPILLVAVTAKNRRYAYIEENLEAAARKIADDAIEFGHAQAVLRAAGGETRADARLKKNIDEHRKVFQDGLNTGIVPGILCMIIPICAFVAAVILGFNSLLHGDLAVSDAAVLFIIGVRYVQPLGIVVENSTIIGVISKCLDRVLEILHTPALPEPRKPVTDIRGTDIELSNVTFAYDNLSDDPSRPALRNVSFVCPAGSTTALVGSSGAGKTTVTRLIPRFFDVNEGSVRIGGVDVRDYDQASLLRSIAVIFQEVYLFNGTIEENLRLARPNASMEQLEYATRHARLDEVIARLPDGWRTQVGEGGAMLSGGERQRVSIARAFLKEAPIVIIDEAVSALDPHNERVICDAIAELADDPMRTVVIIAHHPAILASANRVVSLRGGQVAETGTPEELLRTGGIFANLYKQHEIVQSRRIGIGA